jgi:magnesium-transporting ATPase (P-type)
MALRYIYDKRKNFEIKVLLKLMNKFGRVFFSMSSFEKALLIKINREIFNKKICMVGDGFNDIDAIMSSDVGIFIGQQRNLNTLLSHYFIDENGLMNIERIIKNGRGYCENDNHLLPVNVCFTSLWLLLIIYSYYIETLVNSMMLTLLNLSVFILCVSGFSIAPDYDINYNNLAPNEKLLKIFNFLRIFGTFVIKAISHIFIYFVYTYNEDIELRKNKEIFMSYIFLIIWAQSMSIVFSFNINTFYRKTILSNFSFFMIYIAFFSYIILLLTVNDISIGNSDGYITLSFEFSKKHLDYLDDTHKLFVLYIILYDLLSSCIFFLILKQVFIKIANKYKQNQLNKQKKE